MKKSLYLLLTCVVLAACKSTTKPVTSGSGGKTAIADFISFIGVQKGDDFDKVRRVLGKPSEIDAHEGNSYTFATCYYNDASDSRMFSYTYDKKTKVVNHIRLTGNRSTNFEETKRYLAATGIKDPKISFLGMHKDDILDMFGKPDRVNSGNYEYTRGAVDVTFICYDFHQHKCSEVYLFWNMYK